jgi:predicted nucleotidyltransferase
MSLPDTISTQAQAEETLNATIDLAKALWRERLVAGYALGSLAHGGFRPLVSDIDIGLVFAEPLLAGDEEAVKDLRSTIEAGGRPFSDRLSIFWGSLASLSGTSPGGRFPPLDRLDLLEFGRLVTGRDVRTALSVPTREELLVVGSEFALWRLDRGDVAALLKDPAALLRTDPKTLTKLVLYPVRFLFTARTGEVGRNDAAVAHLVAAGASPASKLAAAALGWRSTPPAHSDSDAIRAIGAGLLPLYREFFLDHEPRLRACGQADLADAFEDWRHRLLA